MKNIFGNKFSGLVITMSASVLLAACNTALPPCHDELNECGHDSAYTEERTVKENRKMASKPMPAVMPASEPVAMPETAPEPEPAPVITEEPVVDTQVMQSADPKFNQISK